MGGKIDVENNWYLLQCIEQSIRKHLRRSVEMVSRDVVIFSFAANIPQIR